MLTDERLASALGFKVGKVYQESRTRQYGTPGNGNVQPQVNESDTGRDLVVLEAGEAVARRPNWSTSQGPYVGTLTYIIILILLSASIFGLEVYRIREVNVLTDRMDLVHNNLDLIRNQLMIAMASPRSEREFVDLIKSANALKITEKPHTEYHHARKKRDVRKREEKLKMD